MSFVATAVVAAGVIGAGATVYASDTAASATTNASNAAIAQQQNALSEQGQLSAPYRALGSAAIPQYEALLGLGPQGTGGIQAALQQTPGYQFALQQGETGIENAASATGGVGGNTLAALDQFNTGLASQTYQQNVADIGGAVASGQAAAAGQAQNVGTAAGNIGSTLINQGNTIAGINANEAAGLTKVASSGIDQYTTMQALNALNNPGSGAGYGGEASPGAGAGTVSAGGGYTFSTGGP
jgi:predicted ribonuclease toxin of YeeF-YezG toxin-antitoxin module